MFLIILLLLRFQFKLIEGILMNANLKAARLMLEQRLALILLG